MSPREALAHVREGKECVAAAREHTTGFAASELDIAERHLTLVEKAIRDWSLLRAVRPTVTPDDLLTSANTVREVHL